MNRRRAIGLLFGGAATVSAGAATVGTFRWHSTPRRTPYLTAEHLKSLNATEFPKPSVLFIGNSMVLRHDVPARTVTAASADGIALSVATAAANSARLIETIRHPNLAPLLQPNRWSAIVLQDFTRTPLRAPDRWGSLYAMNWVARRATDTPTVLYPPWPALARHRVYRDAGFLASIPSDPADYTARTLKFYKDAAASSGFQLSDVPTAWANAIAAGERLHDSDGFHANEKGATLAAQVLWKTIKGIL